MAEDQNGGGDKNALAMLIDGDNAQPCLIKEMLAEAGKYGRSTIRRIYGDWTTPNMNGWKDSLQAHAIQPVQQFRYTIGKNATDSAMIIEAMDILHARVVHGFCLVSSDSDYTRLATRLRESGAFVMGIGHRTTPEAFKSACEVFVFVENLRVPVEAPAVCGPDKAPVTDGFPMPEVLPLLREAFDLRVQDDGWAHLSSIGDALRTRDPSFDHRSYGFRNLRALVENFPWAIELREEKTPAGHGVLLMRFK